MFSFSQCSYSQKLVSAKACQPSYPIAVGAPVHFRFQVLWIHLKRIVLFLIMSVYVSVCESTHTDMQHTHAHTECRQLKRPEEDMRFFDLELQTVVSHPIGALEPKLRSSGGAASALSPLRCPLESLCVILLSSRQNFKLTTVFENHNAHTHLCLTE